MPNARNRNPAPLSEEVKADYSYNQWRHAQVEQLERENQRLRELLSMRERTATQAIGAQVIYDAADPYSRRAVIDRGQTHGVVAGSPVIDDSGVLGQVTRVFPLVSEVTLLVDPHSDDERNAKLNMFRSS